MIPLCVVFSEPSGMSSDAVESLNFIVFVLSPQEGLYNMHFFLLLNLAVFSTSFYPFSSQGHCLCNFYGDLIIVMHLRMKDFEIKIHFLIIPS